MRLAELLNILNAIKALGKGRNLNEFNASDLAKTHFKVNRLLDEQLRAVRREKMRKLGRSVGMPRYGYQVHPTLGIVVMNLAEQVVIAHAVRGRQAKLGTDRIARYLNRLGFLDRTGSTFQAHQVYRMLINIGFYQDRGEKRCSVKWQKGYKKRKAGEAASKAAEAKKTGDA